MIDENVLREVIGGRITEVVEEVFYELLKIKLPDLTQHERCEIERIVKQITEETIAVL